MAAVAHARVAGKVFWLDGTSGRWRAAEGLPANSRSKLVADNFSSGRFLIAGSPARESTDLNFWGQPIKGTKVDLGSFVCTRIPEPGPAPDLDRAVYGQPVDLLANGLADWEEVQKAKPLPNQWSFTDGVLSTAHKLTPQGGWVAGCNLKTKKADFGDCKISFDFRLPEFSNSGVWLRGNYEINICDSFGWAIDNRNSGVRRVFALAPDLESFGEDGVGGGKTIPSTFRASGRLKSSRRAACWFLGKAVSSLLNF